MCRWTRRSSAPALFCWHPQDQRSDQKVDGGRLRCLFGLLLNYFFTDGVIVVNPIDHPPSTLFIIDPRFMALWAVGANG